MCAAAVKTTVALRYLLLKSLPSWYIILVSLLAIIDW